MSLYTCLAWCFSLGLTFSRLEFIFPSVFNLSFHVSEFKVGAWLRQLMRAGSGGAALFPLSLLSVQTNVSLASQDRI